jgi:SAM-dependent methyltransferase
MMIIHKLVYRYLRHGDDEFFYRMQAQETVRWLKSVGVEVGRSVTVLDLGCGHGMIGGELSDSGCQVVFADESNCLLPEYRGADLRIIDIEKDDITSLGRFDLVISSNVLEHISDPRLLIGSIEGLLKPGGLYYLSWTNALSPWWGHEFSPFHYLGARRGARVYDRLIGRPRKHTPYVNLFPTSIGGTLKLIRTSPELRVVKVVPRYYPELSFIASIPLLREFLTFNCAVLVERLPSTSR